MSTHPSSPTTRDEALLRRIRGEFLEMPGLRLTCAQAQRLWALDPETCAAVLDVLVESEFLMRLSDGRYARTSDGAAVAARTLRMAKAGSDSRASDRPLPRLRKH